jgi:hypothetical protein
MTKTLKSIRPLQFGKIAGATYGLLSLIFVPFFLLFALLGSVAMPANEAQNLPSTAIIIAACLMGAIFIPIVYAVMGFIFGVIAAWGYNVIAGWIGGIQVDVE